MMMLLIIRALLTFRITKAEATANPKTTPTNIKKGTTSSSNSKENVKVLNGGQNNPIVTITFEGGKNNPTCKVLLKRPIKCDLILYRSKKPNDPDSYTLSHMIDDSDVKSDGAKVKKFKLPPFTDDDRSYTYCVAVREKGDKSEETYYSEAFQFCPSQNKFMLTREAKNHKSTTSAAWIALGIAILALVLILGIIFYRFFC